MRLQEPITRYGVNDRLLLHQILAVSPSARKLSGWEAPSSLLLWSAPNDLRSSCPYPSHIDKAQTAVYMPACRLVGGFFNIRTFFSGAFLLQFWWHARYQCRSCRPVVRRLAFSIEGFRVDFLWRSFCLTERQCVVVLIQRTRTIYLKVYNSLVDYARERTPAVPSRCAPAFSLLCAPVHTAVRTGP